jgi:hypothetical protein
MFLVFSTTVRGRIMMLSLQVAADSLQSAASHKLRQIGLLLREKDKDGASHW